MMSHDFDYWAELLFRRKNAFLETAGIIFGLVVLGTLLWPPVYQSTAKIFVQNNRAQLLVSPDLQNESSQNPGIVANPVSEQDLNSEVELLTWPNRPSPVFRCPTTPSVRACYRTR
jgi:uncharacterized protein involved in exopolysaccharide biosynthesis